MTWRAGWADLAAVVAGLDLLLGLLLVAGSAGGAHPGGDLLLGLAAALTLVVVALPRSPRRWWWWPVCLSALLPLSPAVGRPAAG